MNFYSQNRKTNILNNIDQEPLQGAAREVEDVNLDLLTANIWASNTAVGNDSYLNNVSDKSKNIDKVVNNTCCNSLPICTMYCRAPVLVYVPTYRTSRLWLAFMTVVVVVVLVLEERIKSTVHSFLYVFLCRKQLIEWMKFDLTCSIYTINIDEYSQILGIQYDVSTHLY